MPENYTKQLDLRCCSNCINSDSDDDCMFCALTMEIIDPVGICDLIELNDWTTK